MDLADKLSELAQALSQASAAVGILEAIEEVLEEYGDGELSLEEAIEEIQGLVEEFQAVRALSEMSPEEIMALAQEAEEEEEDEGGLRS
jgi:predicted DNA-binding protein